MAFQLSPGVTVVEKDFTSIVPAVATSTGAFAGTFQWGPVLEPVTISSENSLVQRFGAPVTANAQAFFTAANFLAYSNNLLVVRADTEGQRNAVALLTGVVDSVTVDNGGAAYSNATVSFSAPEAPTGVTAEGTVTIVGNEITEIVITNPGSGYTNPPDVTIIGDGSNATATAVLDTAAGIKIKNTDDYTTNYVNGAGVVGEWAAKYPGSVGNSIMVSMADAASFATWEYRNEFTVAPGTSTYVDENTGNNDELHIIVIDYNGKWTGTAGAILEKYEFVSKASDARREDGTNNYYKNVINSRSRYIWWMDHPTTTGTGAWGSPASNTSFNDLTVAVDRVLVGGTDDLDATDGDLQTAYAIFADDLLYDVSLIPLGKASATLASYVIGNVAEVRKDCVVFLSPEDVTTGDIIIGTTSENIDKVIEYRDALSSSSYAFMDSGYKYQYDRYNDTYRWVPLNGDVAGLAARTDYTNDPWFSPAGMTRGQIKNVVKLAINPGRTDRDNLYKSGVNPVVTFPGEGTVLYGDKTLLAKPSAFDRINVRRLFIVLEKAIATAAKYQLFELNDPFTRAQFRNLVEPFLRDVQGRRGITDFRVVCDESNNTGEVIDRNEFVADIFIAPTRSINFITLNFVATRTGVNFTEITG